MVSYNLTPEQEADVEALVRAGIYANRSEVLRDALRHRIATLPPETRLRAAIGLYQGGHATISRAAELAGLAFYRMRQILRQENLLRFAGNEESVGVIRAKSARLLQRTR